MIPITRNSTQKPGISPWHPGTLWHSLTEPVISIQKPEQRRQMRLLSSLLIALIFLALLASILVLFFPNAVANFRIVVMAVVVLAFAYRLSRTRHYTLAAVLMVSVTLASVFTATLINPQAYTIGFLALGILLCSLLLSLWATVIVFMVTLIGIALLLAVVPGLFWQNFVDALYLVGCVGALAIIAAAIHQQDLRQIEQQSHQLSEREKRFLALIEHSSDAITLVRSDGTILYASPALSRILGFPLEDLGHAVLLDLAHPEDRALIEAWWTALIQEPGKLSTQQYRMRHRDGAWRWLEITAHNLLAEPSVQAIVNTFRDITEHKEAQVLLEEAERRYRMLFEEAPVMYVISRHQGKSPIIADCNQLFLSTLGYTHAEVLGRPVADFYTPKSHSLLRQNGYQQAAAGQFFVQERELVKRDGQVVKTLLHARPDVDQAGHVLGVRATYVDITERTHAEEQIKHQIERLAALRAIDLAIIASTDLHLSLSAVMNATIKQLQMDAAAILILNAHTQILECAEQIGFHTRVQPRNRLHLGEGHGGEAALERRTVYIPHLAEAPDLKRDSLFKEEGFVTYFGVPLIAKGRVQGVLELFHRTRLEPDAEWLEYMETLAGQAAIALDNAKLFDHLQRANTELGMAYDATITGWSRALDLRDKETEGHTQRVTEVTEHLAGIMGMSEEEMVHIRRGALLHDIGKMGIPDGILLKPGPLTAEEWEIMRQHPVYAYELLAPIVYLRPALYIPYCHHEKWDGTGYPRGLKGEQIPLAARIFAVVDVWDALRSDRPYRPAWPEEKVREYLQAQAGRHFDPRVAEAFLRLLETDSLG